MKKLLVLFVVSLLFSASGFTTFAQGQDAKNPDRAATGTPSKKTLRISGTVGNGGLALISDRDNKTWKVANPNLLKDSAGLHVNVKALVQKDEIYISSVRLAPVQSPAARLGDTAFRR
jgi:hypothetical protein